MADYQSGAFRFLVTIGEPFMRHMTRQEWRGLEHVPAEGGCIIAPNHTSNFDPLAVAHFIVIGAKRAVHFLGKKEVVEMPVLGKLFQAAGQIPVHRGTTNAINAYKDAIDALNRGECIGIYPEGTTTKEPNNWPMIGKTGAARMALATGVPVIPIAQWGPEEVMPNNKGFAFRILPRKTMRVVAGPPVDLDDLRGRDVTSEVLAEATERIMRDITGLLEPLRGEKAPAVRFNPRARGGEQ